MKRILIAEDEVMLLKSIEFKLKKDGYEVVAVSDGQAAVDSFLTESFDLVVTDVMMPYKSGLELC